MSAHRLPFTAHAILEAMPAGGCIVDAHDLRVIVHNRCYQSFLRGPYRTSGVVGLRIPEYLPSAKEAGVLDGHRQVTLTGEPLVIRGFPYQGLARDPIYWDYYVAPLRDERGEIAWHLVTAWDVTERVQTQRRAKEADGLVLDVLDSITDGFFALDREWRLVYINRGVERILRWERGELIGKNVWDTFPEAVGSTFYDELHKVVTREVVVQFEAFCPPLDVWVEVRAYPAEGGVAGYLRDLTERKRSEEANVRLYEEARHRSERLAALVEVARKVSSTLDTEEVYAIAFDQLQRLIPGDRYAVAIYEPELRSFRLVAIRCAPDLPELWPVGACIPESDAVSTLACQAGRTVILGDTRQHPVAAAKQAAAAGWNSVLMTPILAQGRWLGTLSVMSRHTHAFDESQPAIVDAFAAQIAVALENAKVHAQLVASLAEVEATQEQLHRAQKMEAIGRLAGGVAHDFGNLLTAIIGFSELALQGLAPTNPLRGHLDEIWQASVRAGALTDRLLTISRKQAVEPRLVSLNAVVANVEQLLRRLIGEDINLVVVLEPALGRTRADPGRIEQVLMNLAVNARDAMPGGGALTIKTANAEVDGDDARLHPTLASGAYVVLQVSDTGCGMDVATRARIFEPFFTTKGPGKGTGLGLSIVYGIVAQSRGHIAVDSAAGQGATFTIYLPRAAETPEEPVSPGQAADLPSGTETVLLAEDEESVRSLVCQMLQQRGYTVLMASCGDEALRMSERYADPIHLLVTDVVMPGMSGREVAERLLLCRPKMKVLYMSGYLDETVARHGVLNAGLAFLRKPFATDALVWKVRKVLDTY